MDTTLLVDLDLYPMNQKKGEFFGQPFRTRLVAYCKGTRSRFPNYCVRVSVRKLLVGLKVHFTRSRSIGFYFLVVVSGLPPHKIEI